MSRATLLDFRRYFASSGSIMTNLPIEPLSRNLMRPVILAKRVSSLPRPTLRPGFTRVPRWRTMMVPPGTICPPKALKPAAARLSRGRFVNCLILFYVPLISVSSFWFLVSNSTVVEGGATSSFSAPTSSALLSWLRLSLPGLCAFASALGASSTSTGLTFFGFGFFLREVGGGEFLAVVGDLGDADRGVSLAMSAQLLVLLLALVVEDQNFCAAALLHDFAGHQRRWIPGLPIWPLAGDGQHVAKLDLPVGAVALVLQLESHRRAPPGTAFHRRG